MIRSSASRRCRLALLLSAALFAPLPLAAEAAFQAPADFAGRFRVESATPGQPAFAGGKVRITASGLTPGQSLTLQSGTVVLTPAPVQADEKGALSVTLDLPATAAPGLHPVIAILEDPAMVSLVDLKVSKDIALQGVDAWNVTEVRPARGLYQSAFSAASDALFVTAADYTAGTSELLKLNPETLEVLARITPADFPEDQKPEKKGGKGNTRLAPAGVFGVAVDDKAGTVWVTNTPDNTVAIYRQSDLSLVRQLPPGTTYHSREVVIDTARGHAFVSSSASANVTVFDTTTFDEVAKLTIPPGKRGGDFYVMNLALNPETSEVYVTSRVSNELAVIDAQTLTVKEVLPLPGVKNATGLAVDPATGRIFVTGQDSDNLVILNRDGSVLQDVDLGAGALSVIWDPVNNLAWVAARGAGRITAVDAEGQIRAHLDGGSYANHVATDGKGAIFATNKSLGADDPTGDFVRRITAK